MPPGAANSANCSLAIGDTTDVGAYTNTTNFYGTFDQGGNVWEFHERVPPSFTTFRGIAGGGLSSPAGDLAASSVGGGVPVAFEDFNLGFRVVSVPEASSLLYGGVVLLTILCWRWLPRFSKITGNAM